MICLHVTYHLIYRCCVYVPDRLLPPPLPSLLYRFNNVKLRDYEFETKAIRPIHTVRRIAGNGMASTPIGANSRTSDVLSEVPQFAGETEEGPDPGARAFGVNRAEMSLVSPPESRTTR